MTKSELLLKSWNYVKIEDNYYTSQNWQLWQKGQIMTKIWNSLNMLFKTQHVTVMWKLCQK